MGWRSGRSRRGGRLGHELGGSLEDKSVEDESEPGNPVDGREEAEDVIF